MHQPPEAGSLGEFLVDAIKAAGFRSASAFARAAGLDPSVVLRWIAGSSVPSPQNLMTVAPLLNMTPRDLVTRVHLDGEPVSLQPTDPLVVEIAAMLDPRSPLTADEREMIRAMLDRVIDPARKAMRRRRKR